MFGSNSVWGRYSFAFYGGWRDKRGFVTGKWQFDECIAQTTLRYVQLGQSGWRKLNIFESDVGVFSPLGG